MAENERPTPPLNIRCDPDVRESFVAFCERHDVAYGKGLENLLTGYVPPRDEPEDYDPQALVQYLKCTASEIDEINQAVQHTNFRDLVKDGLLRQVRRINTSHSKIESGVLDSHTRRGVHGGGYPLIVKAAQALTAHNESTPDDAVYISKGLLAKASRTHQTSVEQFWQDHGAEIEQHNAAMGFVSTVQGSLHNRRNWNAIQRLIARMHSEEENTSVERETAVNS